MATIISHSPEETFRAGSDAAAQLCPGDVLALDGPLGAGKTQWVKGLAAGLGSAAPVTSPTFTLIHEYPGGRLPLYHMDCYRSRLLANCSPWAWTITSTGAVCSPSNGLANSRS